MFSSLYRPCAILLVAAICTISGNAQSSPANDRQELLTLEQSWLDAIQHRDLKFLDALLDDAFVDTPPDGHLRSKQDVLKTPVAQNVESEKLQDLSVRLHGDVAVVTGVNVVTGREHSYVATVHFTDVFQKQAGKWKAIAAQENLSVKHP